jgi:hypothetical protein
MLDLQHSILAPAYEMLWETGWPPDKAHWHFLVLKDSYFEVPIIL